MAPDSRRSLISSKVPLFQKGRDVGVGDGKTGRKQAHPQAVHGHRQLKPTQNTVPQKSINSLETLGDTFSTFRLVDFAFVTPLDRAFRLSEGKR